MDIRFRTGGAGEGEAVFRVLERAFCLEPGSRSWEQKRQEAFRSPESFQVMEREGRIIGVAHVRRDRLRVGRCAIVKGDVGEVSVDPQFQGQGYGSALMQHVVAWMRQQGFHLSRLGGSVRFYSRFGWVPFPRRYVEFPLTPVRAGALTLPPEAGLELSPDLERCLRDHDPDHDAAGRRALYHHFNENRTGSLVLEEEGGEAKPGVPSLPVPPSGPGCVFDRDGEMLGYLLATEYPRDITEFEARLTIGEVAYRRDHPEALEAMLKHALRWAVGRGIRRATARLPFDEEVLGVLRRAGLSFIAAEMETAVASNMLRIVHLPSLLEAILPELEARLAASPYPDWCGRFEVSLESEAVELTVANGRLQVSNPPGEEVPPAGFRLATDTATLMRLILGLNGFGETALAAACPDRAAAAVLAALFPRQPTASGPWG